MHSGEDRKGRSSCTHCYVAPLRRIWHDAHPHCTGPDGSGEREMHAAISDKAMGRMSPPLYLIINILDALLKPVQEELTQL